MSIEQTKGRTWPVGLLSALVILAGTAAAQADPGFSQPYTAFTSGEATSDTWTTVEAGGAFYESHTFADAASGAEVEIPGGLKEAWANAAAGNFTNFVVEGGEAQYDQQKSARAQIYAKGDNVLAKARSENQVVIYIDGRAYVVVEEIARALSRTTKDGTYSIATGDTNISAASGGYLEVITKTETDASGGTQN
ncbi:hypothetical protein [Dichotomicrobium thermohalophilum]|uniref:Lipopolysaccharide export system protein LptA n=1 Tax=Dichotomicrobium thermohalophilum TaxID=933063 RepID=A0A397PJQ4_9HYPH|nr:hypothetical protein [Dichotomicrobium thermohalophilum]RIA47495.1 hypothetical protein BXY53_2049 [Dichotomicrobium thermohalophilum]